MEAVSSDRTLLKEIFNRFTEPAKYKIKLYQIAVLMYIDQLLTLLINKYMFFRVAIEEKKTNLKITSFEQSQIKLDLFSKENIKRTLVLVEKIKSEAHVKFGNWQLSKKPQKRWQIIIFFRDYRKLAIDARTLRDTWSDTGTLLRAVYPHRFPTDKPTVHLLHEISLLQA